VSLRSRAPAVAGGMMRHPSLLTALLVLALQVALWGADAPNESSSLGPWPGYALCHGRVSVERPGHESPASAPGDCEFCPACLTLQATDMLAPPPDTVLIPAVPALALRLPLPAANLSALRNAGVHAQPRAPPVLA
jgi:hypothetical protein